MKTMFPWLQRQTTMTVLGFLFVLIALYGMTAGMFSEREGKNICRDTGARRSQRLALSWFTLHDDLPLLLLLGFN